MGSKVVSLREAVAAHVHDGDLLAIEGFTHLISFAAAHEVIRQKKKRLTLVRMTPDLKLATAYIFPLGGEGASEVVAHLEKHKRFLRGEVAKRVSMKFIPELRFKIDTSFETSRRIEELLASPKVARDLDLDD